MPNQAVVKAREPDETITRLAYDLDDHDIAALAFELWQARGCPMGSPDEDWFRAIEVLQVKAERSRSSS